MFGDDFNKFQINECELPEQYHYLNILSVSSSKKYIYLLSKRGELLFLESKTLNPINISYCINSSYNCNNSFKEYLTKIWTDRNGNHNIIRYEGKIYYFTIYFTYNS